MIVQEASYLGDVVEGAQAAEDDARTVSRTVTRHIGGLRHDLTCFLGGLFGFVGIGQRNGEPGPIEGDFAGVRRVVPAEDRCEEWDRSQRTT